MTPEQKHEILHLWNLAALASHQHGIEPWLFHTIWDAVRAYLSSHNEEGLRPLSPWELIEHNHIPPLREYVRQALHFARVDINMPVERYGRQRPWVHYLMEDIQFFLELVRRNPYRPNMSPLYYAPVNGQELHINMQSALYPATTWIRRLADDNMPR